MLRYGAKGSIVLVTTRIEMVALRMATTFVHQMGRLSEEDSWDMFQRLALGMRRKEEQYKNAITTKAMRSQKFLELSVM
ncbi:hypothetical protein OIU74_015570 [Salix koriyanagi]|uniref:NB-ARC domain-containing protein n=1 Tax=Salix koriyanagi TaxID=2511006 RepID=A0A9Q0SVJ5_9ROSI|nr:hypothetical protein OIU74_015570 [Salix koriyanagi]